MDLSNLEIKQVYDGLWAVMDCCGMCYGSLVRSVTGSDEWVFFSYDAASCFYGKTQEESVLSWLNL